MTFRLECVTMDNNPPAVSGIHAENILLHLVKLPRSSLTYISEERISLERAAAVVDDGLHSAIDELVRSEGGLFI
ncbi:hypothetical protein J3A83DRAFT_4212905 [Scleroderma citrinum]